MQKHFDGSYGIAHAYIKLAEISDDDWTAILTETNTDPDSNLNIREIERRRRLRKKGANEPTSDEWELQVRQSRRSVARTLLHLIESDLTPIANLALDRVLHAFGGSSVRNDWRENFPKAICDVLRYDAESDGDRVTFLKTCSDKWNAHAADSLEIYLKELREEKKLQREGRPRIQLLRVRHLKPVTRHTWLAYAWQQKLVMRGPGLPSQYYPWFALLVRDESSAQLLLMLRMGSALYGPH